MQVYSAVATGNGNQSRRVIGVLDISDVLLGFAALLYYLHGGGVHRSKRAYQCLSYRNLLLKKFITNE